MMEIPFLRTPYNYDVDKVSDETGLRCEDASLAIQSQREDADINVIMKRFGLSGELPQNSSKEPVYADVSDMPRDLMSALEAVRKAEESFDALSDPIKRRFGYNSEEFVQFVTNGNNIEELKSMGLIEKKAPQDAERAPADNEQAKPAPSPKDT